jgi:hypothetical protein
VKRSSSSSSEASKVSTVGTVSNTFEIVTVTPRKCFAEIITYDEMILTGPPGRTVQNSWRAIQYK